MTPQTKTRRVWTVVGAVCLVLAGGRLCAADSPWYVAARFGEASAEARFGTRHPKRVDDKAGSAAAELGYRVNRYVAVEAGYHDLGSHTGFGSPCLQTDDACIERLAGLGLCVEGFECTEVLTALDAEISGFSLALVPSWALGERLSLRGKVGLLAWDSNVSTRGFGQPESFSGEEIVAGIGLQYSLPSGLGVLLQHEELDLDLGVTSLGLSWEF